MTEGFKVGDRVQISRLPGGGVPKSRDGMIGTIVRVSRECCVRFDDGQDFWCSPVQLCRIDSLTTLEKPVFRAGDRVRLVFSTSPIVAAGAIGMIDCPWSDPETWRVFFPGAGNLICRTDQLRCVDIPTPTPKPCYKFGDRVLLKKMNSEGIILQVDPDAEMWPYYIAVQGASGVHEEWYSESDVSPVETRLELKVGMLLNCDGQLIEVIEDQGGNWLPMRTSVNWLPRTIQVIREAK